MDLAELKPILTALALPPAGPLLLALFGVLLALRRRAAGTLVAVVALVAAYLLATNGAAVMLARALLPQAPPVQLQQLKTVQAIVVLGGGVLPEAAEYGMAQPSDSTLRRARYGAWLARGSGKPLAFAGGIGWAAAGLRSETEAVVARRVLQDELKVPVRWSDDQSRDTGENARRMAQAMRADGIRRIALVTDATHMPRAAAHFRAAGFEVLPAPINYPIRSARDLLEWVPSPQGVNTTRAVLHEWLGQRLTGAPAHLYGDFTLPKAELP
jgi:uncharacterized SAM-binding protein YcdF (DUF218 family)